MPNDAFRVTRRATTCRREHSALRRRADTLGRSRVQRCWRPAARLPGPSWRRFAELGDAIVLWNDFPQAARSACTLLHAAEPSPTPRRARAAGNGSRARLPQQTPRSPGGRSQVKRRRRSAWSPRGCETVSGRVRPPDGPPHGPPGRCPPDAPITIAPQCPAVTPRRQREPAGGGTPSWRQIARAVPVGISRCRGTGDLRSRETLDQMAWLAPSRIGWQPYSRRCDSSSRLVKRRGRS